MVMQVQKEQTFWNGEPTPCRRVRVRVGKSLFSTWWCAALEGTERNAVEVRYGGRTFYLDDDEAPDGFHHAGCGWGKVTTGRGGPDCYHADLPTPEQGTVLLGSLPCTRVEPLPCPFCGDAPSVLEDHEPMEEVQVSCSRERGNADGECWASPFVDAPTVEAAVAIWNRRAP